MRFRVGGASLACVLLLGVAGVAGAQAAIEIEAPSGAQVATGASDLAFVAGRVAWFGPGRDALDLALLIDVSDSTDEPSAESPPPAPSLWRRVLTWFGRRPRLDPSHTLLGDELRAAAALLGELDPARTRVALVAFAGGFDPSLADAWTEVPLTADFSAVRAGLSRLLRRGPAGLTRPDAGMHRALVELLGTRSSGADARASAHRAIALFTDARGPYGRTSLDGSFPAAIRRAQLASVRVDVLAFGEEARRPGAAARDWTTATGGEWLDAAAPASRRRVLGSIRYALVAEVSVRNRTTGALAERVALGPDGGFACLLPLRFGPNQVEVSARLSDGARLARTLELSRRDDAAPIELSARLLLQRRRLLADRLHAGEPERALVLSPEAPASAAHEAGDEVPASPMIAP